MWGVQSPKNQVCRLALSKYQPAATSFILICTGVGVGESLQLVTSLVLQLGTRPSKGWSASEDVSKDIKLARTPWKEDHVHTHGDSGDTPWHLKVWECLWRVFLYIHVPVCTVYLETLQPKGRDGDRNLRGEERWRNANQSDERTQAHPSLHTAVRESWLMLLTQQLYGWLCLHSSLFRKHYPQLHTEADSMWL